MLGSARADTLSYLAAKLFSKNSNLCLCDLDLLSHHSALRSIAASRRKNVKIIAHLQGNVQPEHSRLRTEDVPVSQWFGARGRILKISRLFCVVMDVDAWVIALDRRHPDRSSKHGCIEYVEKKWSQ